MVSGGATLVFARLLGIWFFLRPLPDGIPLIAKVVMLGCGADDTYQSKNSWSELLSCATAMTCEQILLETHCGQFESQMYWLLPFSRTM